LALRDIRADVGRRDRGHAAPGEIRCQVFLDSAFKLVERATTVHLVLRERVCRRFLEAESIQLRGDRDPIGDSTLSATEHVARDFLRSAPRRLLMPLAVSIVSNPPDVAALTQFTHCLTASSRAPRSLFCNKFKEPDGRSAHPHFATLPTRDGIGGHSKDFGECRLRETEAAAKRLDLG